MTPDPVTPKTDPELLRLLEKAKGYRMTPAEIQAQRISWVYGQIAMEDDRVTREMVEQALADPVTPSSERNALADLIGSMLWDLNTQDEPDDQSVVAAKLVEMLGTAGFDIVKRQDAPSSEHWLLGPEAVEAAARERAEQAGYIWGYLHQSWKDRNIAQAAKILRAALAATKPEREVERRTCWSVATEIDGETKYLGMGRIYQVLAPSVVSTSRPDDDDVIEGDRVVRVELIVRELDRP